MYFLKQIERQLRFTIFSYDAPSENAAGGIVEDEQNPSSTEQQQGPQTAEALAFQELNEKLDALDNDSQIVSTYTTILGDFLAKVKAGEYEGLSEDDSDFQRLLTLYKAKFEELKDMRNRGHEIEHVISMYMNKLDNTVDRGAEGEDIDDALDSAYEEELRARQSTEEQEGLLTQRDSLIGIIRGTLNENEIDIESEEFKKYSEEAQIVIRLAFELSDRNRELSSGKSEEIIKDIIQLEDVHRDLSIVLNNEEIPGEESLSEVAKNHIEAEFLKIKENGTEIQKEIIGNKSFLDMRKGDFMRLWLEGEVDLKELFLKPKTSGIGESGVGDTYNIYFGGNPEVRRLLSSIIPISVEKIVVDGKTATRTGEREFRLEGGLPVSVREGSEIVIQENNLEMTPEQVETRVDSYRESMASNMNREEFERRVNSQIQQREMNGDENTDGWLATIIKKILNGMAEAMGEDPIFEEVLEQERETLYGYSGEDSNRIQRQGMRRFSPDGQEILQDSEFMNGLNAMCNRLGVQRDDMLIVMQAESGLNPQAINPSSQASGLIQFMPRTAEGLGTSVSAIQRMTAVEQLVYVEKYFENYAGRMNSVADIYRVVFYPASIGKPANWVFGSQNGTAEAVARQNGPGITKHSHRSDGLIDNATFDRYVDAKISQFSDVVSSGTESPGSVRSEGIGEITRGIRSRDMERSSSGTTLCSKTARLNLTDLGVSNPYQGNSARASFEMYGSHEISGFPPSSTDATVADLYLDASPGNREYGHRAACFKQDGQWYVLDPYYRMGRSESQRNNPILAEDYISYMQSSLGRRIWGAAYYK